MRPLGVVVLVLGIVSTGACRARDQAAAAEASPESSPVVPVRTAPVRLATLESVTSAPGHTVALVQQKIRAPFAGSLVTLSVMDGDRVLHGSVVGTIVSRDSEAALTGAREMEREAKTSAEREDAQRARMLAERNLIHAVLRAPSDGVVLSHAAAPGDRVTEDQEILALADYASLAFVADVSQTDVARIRPGQRASIDLPGRPHPESGVVHDILPTANATDFTVPVRIDWLAPPSSVGVGHFGTAHVATSVKPNVIVVPEAAVLRDDVSGTARIAIVRNGRAHWEDVTTGLRGTAEIEITSPTLSVGDQVVIEGLVGLPEGAAVISKP